MSEYAEMAASTPQEISTPDLLDTHLAQLEGTIGDLTKRLQPVLRGESPMVGVDKLMPPDRSRLSGQVERLAEIHGNLVALIRRIDL